jgi:preprotein translocase subunit SecD
MRLSQRQVIAGAALLGLVGVSAFVGWWLLRPPKPAKPDIDKVGGTILAYEPEDAAVGQNEAAMQDLVEALQRRFEQQEDTAVVTVRAAGGRVEVLVPRAGGSHDARLSHVRGLIRRRGHLDFKIVANQADDQPAIDAAREQERQDAAAGRPPGPVTRPNGKPFEVGLAGGPSLHTYSWARLSPQSVKLLVARPEGTADELRQRGFAAHPFFGVAVCRRDRQGASEYFLLLRDAEAGEEVTGADIRSARKGVGFEGRSTIDFVFSDEAGDRFFDLTTRNRPGMGQKRMLAIVFDGEVVSAPFLNEPIRARGQISGEFTEAEVADLVAILQAGSLPVRLKPDPVSETTVEPK